MQHAIRRFLALIAIAAVGGPSAFGASVLFTFDTGAQGWTSPDPHTSWSATGGNPGGYIQKDDNDDGYRPIDDDWIYAPLSILGDWSSLGPSDRIEFDHRIFETGGDPDFLAYEIRLSGAGGSARWIADVPSGITGWVHHSAALDPTEWIMTSGGWTALLQDVTSLQIRIELVGNRAAPFDIAGIDNILIPLAAVPEPASIMLSSVGLVLVASLSTSRLRRSSRH